MSTAQEHAALAKRLLPQLQKQSDQMQAQLHDHAARLAAAADDLRSQMAAVQAHVGITAATAAAELAATRSRLQGAIDTQAAASKGLVQDLNLLRNTSSAAAEAAASKATAVAAASAALAMQLHEHKAATETQLAALRADLNASVTNAKLEEELQFMSLHEQVRFSEPQVEKLVAFCSLQHEKGWHLVNRDCRANRHTTSLKLALGHCCVCPVGSCLL
jgi:hypothetical protein